MMSKASQEHVLERLQPLNLLNCVYNNHYVGTESLTVNNPGILTGSLDDKHGSSSKLDPNPIELTSATI